MIGWIGVVGCLVVFGLVWWLTSEARYHCCYGPLWFIWPPRYADIT